MYGKLIPALFLLLPTAVAHAQVSGVRDSSGRTILTRGDGSKLLYDRDGNFLATVQPLPEYNYRVTNANGTAIDVDAFGNVTQIRDRNGNPVNSPFFNDPTVVDRRVRQPSQGQTRAASGRPIDSGKTPRDSGDLAGTSWSVRNGGSTIGSVRLQDGGKATLNLRYGSESGSWSSDSSGLTITFPNQKIVVEGPVDVDKSLLEGDRYVKGDTFSGRGWKFSTSWTLRKQF